MAEFDLYFVEESVIYPDRLVLFRFIEPAFCSFSLTKYLIKMQDTFFKDLKVVELASVLAGPAVGMFFAELGAKVIKVENKTTGGDVTRRWKLPNEPAKAEISAYYCSVNWQKETHLLDLTDGHDRAQVQDWLRTADVVISNFKTASAEKLGVDYPSVKTLNPKIIYAHLTAFGESQNRPAFDVVLQAEAGFLYMCGHLDSEPAKMPVALIDLLAAHQLKEGILLALLHRARTGEGSFVTTSLLESAIASLANQATNWLMGGHIPQRMGTQHPNIAPYGDIFLTKDQKTLLLAVGTERQFRELCRILKMENLLADQRFAINAARVQNRVALRQALAPPIHHWLRANLLEQLDSARVPAASIRTMPEVFELPQAQDMILTEPLDDGRQSRRVRTVAFSLKR